MTDNSIPKVTKTALLAEMDAVWREIDALLKDFSDKLDTRMPIDGPAWNGRQFLGHLLGSLQSTPYYLTQPRDNASIESVIGDPYWRQIYATATVSSFHAMMFAAHIGTVMLVESMDETDLKRTAPFKDGTEVSALDAVWFNYHVHLRSHVEDLKNWGHPVNNS
jgi:hypothetical protein